MKRTGGQALLELSLCAPVVLLLALETMAAIQVASAHAGLDAATRAAAEAAARAPNSQAATSAAGARFQAIVAGYPLRSATLVLELGDFGRTGSVTAMSSASIDIAWAAFLPLQGQVTMRSQAQILLERWRSRST